MHSQNQCLRASMQGLHTVLWLLVLQMLEAQDITLLAVTLTGHTCAVQNIA